MEELDKKNVKLGGKFELTEKNAADSPVDDIKWHGQEIEVNSNPLVDPGVGREVVLRSFFFKAAPVPRGFRPPTKPQILSHYKKMIDDFLWKDALVALDHRKPQVYARKDLKKGALRDKMIEENADFVIMILAKPKLGSTVLDTARILK